MSNSNWCEKYIQHRKSDARLTWKIDQLSPGTHYRVLTPNRAEIEIGPEPDWDDRPLKEFQSTLLWKYSLTYLKLIAEDLGDYEFASQTLRTFTRFYFSESGQARLAELTSRDHFAAECMMTLTFLLANKDFTAKQEANRLLSDLIKWGSNPENIAENNHGLMLSSALLHASKFIEDRNFADEAIRTGEAGMLRVLGGAFDPQGHCRENSPAYHAFYLRFMTRLTQDLKFFGEAHARLIATIDALSERGQNALELVAHPDGSLPPLGDGNLTPRYAAPVETGTLFSVENGFYSHKKDGVFFSMKCGFSSCTHKHMDDTSIYLWAFGDTLLTDAGLFNYDWQDEMTLCVKSQRGHSGAFFRRYDSFYPATIYRPNNLRCASSLTLARGPDDGTFLTGSSTLDGEYTVVRKVQFNSLKEIRVLDSFKSPSPEPRIVRFITPNENTVHLSGNSVTISGKSSSLKISTEGSSGVRLLTGIRTPDELAGWACSGFGNASPATTIEFDIPMEAAGMECRLQLGEALLPR